MVVNPDQNSQRALSLDIGDGVPAPPNRPLRRDAGRHDIRRTSEYLAGRGRLPAESLHSVAKLTLPEAVAWLRKVVPGCEAQWAAQFWRSCINDLMPFVHYRLEPLDLAALDPQGALSGGAASHYLAAAAMGARLAEQAAGQGPGAGRATGPAKGALVDSRSEGAFDQATGQVPGPEDEATASVTASLAGLPPKGRD